jgi:hypothetical protein
MNLFSTLALRHCNHAKEPTVPKPIDDEIALLRQALDQAIYTLESIKSRAARGAASFNSDWHCSDIEETASDGLAMLTALLTGPDQQRHAA